MSIRVGIVGYGAQFNMGKHHAEQVRKTPGLCLHGIYDVLPERREAARVEQEGVVVYESYQHMLDDPEVDLVVLVTPHHTHAPLSIAASKAGKHVITEKVMCLNTKEADEMIQAASEAGRVLTVYQNRRWDGDFLTVRKVLETNALGKVFSIESCVNGWWCPPGWRGEKAKGGGMLYDWGAHLSDQLVQLAHPAKPKTVFATLHYGGHPVDVETHATVVVTFDNDIMAQFDVGCISHYSRPRWLIRGEKAALFMKDWNTATVKGALCGLEGELSLPVEKTDWHAFYRNVSRHLLEGEELAVKPEQARLALRIIEAAFESGATGKAINV